MSFHALTALYAAWLFPITWAQTVQSILWKVPDGNLPDLSQTFTAGTTLALSWNQYTSPDYLDATKTLVDLWVTAYDFNTNPFSQLLTENINLTSPGNYAWTIAIPAANLTVDAKYVLRFKVPASTYDPNSADLSSPGFLILRAAAASSTSTSRWSFTPSSWSTLATTLSPSASPTALANNVACSSCGLSTGAKVGIGISVAVAVVLAFVAIIFLVIIPKRKEVEILERTQTEAEPVPTKRDEPPSPLIRAELPSEM